MDNNYNFFKSFFGIFGPPSGFNIPPQKNRQKQDKHAPGTISLSFAGNISFP
jgi:hypothetical protein